MLTSCLIFLCIGVFAAGMPASTSEENLTSLNKEIQDHLKVITNHKNQVVSMAPSNMMGRVFIPVSIKGKHCARLKLKVFIKLLNLWNTDDEMTSIRRKLQLFEEKWTPQEQNSVQICQEKEYPHREFRQVLEDLKWFMKELYCLQENC